MPEVMVGISRKLMMHGDVFFSNRKGRLSAEGESVYGKYRFYSADDVQQHFRMAAYARYSFVTSPVLQEEINLYGYNSGIEAGLIGTALLHKLALSSSLSFIKAMDNGDGNKYPYQYKNSKALNYSLSAGKLLLPKVYNDYKQININLMMELLNQYNPGSGKYFIDAAPSLQFIFNSVARVDIGYRQQLKSSLSRSGSNSLFIRLEYNFFNVY